MQTKRPDDTFYKQGVFESQEVREISTVYF
jgi:hypothetical protein